MICKCRRCGKTPDKLSEYVSSAKMEGVTPEEYVQQNEGTYNAKTGLFYCTDCYIALGMPRGKA